ncbi:MAG: sugar phosphate isomerase/epimerase, partial [Nitrospinaceae bacterium]|nr:sugar phosphate isomerase/epimerase [Nitrospinaceae bacterium]
MNKIGFNLLVWTPHLSDSLYPTIERLKDIGYDGIEVSLG